jgi:hypothetical protein
MRIDVRSADSAQTIDLHIDRQRIAKQPRFLPSSLGKLQLNLSSLHAA